MHHEGTLSGYLTLWLAIGCSVGRGYNDEFINVGYEVFTAVVMKSINFWGITPCHLLACCFLAELITSTLKM
jgi:hypothetical protein